jgi:exodeoxyribonuclease-1
MKSYIPTLYWHDYETFGTDTKLDRPSQFAGIRTDEDLNILEGEEELMLFCKPANDFLPHPMACRVTGVVPQDALKNGVSENQFIKVIHKELSRPLTCGVGYNSIGFDDEVTRNTLYRNFFDPYAREWQNGNSRWDIMNLMRFTALVAPETLTWPLKEDGMRSFRLEELCAANGIIHENAHDALSDVRATIGIAKKVKDAQPRIYQYFYDLRSKNNVSKIVAKDDMMIHIDSVYGGEREYAAIVYPLCVGTKHKSMTNNDVILIDLSRDDMEDWVNLPVEDIKTRLFTKKAELIEQGLTRPGFNKMAINKCPTIAPYKKVKPEKLQELNIDIELCKKNLEYLRKNPALANKISNLFVTDYPKNTDPDAAIYDGFISKPDRQNLDDIRHNNNFDSNHNFQDAKFYEMAFRYKARNFPEQLNDLESNKWEQYRLDRIKNGGSLSIDEFGIALEEMLTTFPESTELAKKMIAYGKEIGDNEIVKKLKSIEESLWKKKIKKNTP